MAKKKTSNRKSASAKARSIKARSTKPRGKGNALPPAGDIPEGMQQLGGGYAPTWKPAAEGEALHGIVTGGVRMVEMTIGRKKQERRCFELTTHGDEQRFTIWESAALGELFDQVTEHGEGLEVYVRYDGLGTAKKGQNPPKLFTCAAAA